MPPAKRKIVFAQVAVAFKHDDEMVRLRPDDPYWADADIVKAHPEYFGDEPRTVYGRRPIEAATRAPGEKRA